MSELTPRNHQLATLGSNCDGQMRYTLPKSPLHRPHSAPHGNHCHFSESADDPPKSDRSHYPKYKPLIFPTPEHDSSNPHYSGPRILTPRIKPCTPPSVGIEAPVLCWSEPLQTEVSDAPPPRPGKSVRSIDDYGCGHGEHSVDNTAHPRDTAWGQARHEPGTDAREFMDSSPTGLTTKFGSLAESASLPGSDTTAGFDELVVEENESPVRTRQSQRHVFVPPMAFAQPPQMNLEDELLTDRQAEAHQSQTAESLVQEAESINTATGGMPDLSHNLSNRVAVTDDPLQSLHASEAGHGSQFSSRLSSGPGVCCAHRGAGQPAYTITVPQNLAAPCAVPETVSATTQQQGHVDGSPCEYINLHLSCDFTDDTHEEASDMHDFLPVAIGGCAPGPPEHLAPHTVFMHDNPLCWPLSPSSSAAASAHATPANPQPCASPQLDAGCEPVHAEFPSDVRVDADNTATKETQTSRRFVASALRAALKAHDGTAGSSASVSISFPSSECIGGTGRLTDSDSAVGLHDMSQSLSLPRACDVSKSTLSTRGAPPLRRPGRGSSGASSHSITRCAQSGALSERTESGTRLSGVASSSAIAVDTSVCLSETGTVFESCCEPSSVRSSLDVTAVSDLSRDVPPSGNAPGYSDTSQDGHDVTTSRTETFEIATSEAVGYFACPPSNGTPALAAGKAHGPDDMPGEATAGVFERMRVALSARLSKLSPRLHPAAFVQDGEPPVAESSAQSVQEAARSATTPRHMVSGPPDPPCIATARADAGSTGLHSPTSVKSAIAGSDSQSVDAQADTKESAPFGPRTADDDERGSQLPCVTTKHSESTKATRAATVHMPLFKDIPKLRLAAAAVDTGCIDDPAPQVLPAGAEGPSEDPVSCFSASSATFSTGSECDSAAEAATAQGECEERRASASPRQHLEYNTDHVLGSCQADNGLLSSALSKMEDTPTDLLDAVQTPAAHALSGTGSLAGSQSAMASFLHDSSTTSCSAPSFRFTVHDTVAQLDPHEPACVTDNPCTNVQTHEGPGSSSSAFCFPATALEEDGNKPPGSPTTLDGTWPAAHITEPHAAATAAGGREWAGHAMYPGVHQTMDEGSMSMPQRMSHSAMPGVAAAPFAALTPCTSCPMRLETVDEHTPSPMQPLLAPRFYMPPACTGKVAPSLHAANGDMAPDITWSPFRHRGVRMPSPNYCSPAALGAMHGLAPLNPPDRAATAVAEMQVPPLQPSCAHIIACDEGEPVSANAAATNARRPWLRMSGTPRTASSDGQAHSVEQSAGTHAAGSSSCMQRGRGAGTATPGPWQAAARHHVDAWQMLSLPTAREGGRDEWSMRDVGSINPSALPGPAEQSASGTATTVSLSDALLPMPPGDAATESSELQVSMPRAACTPARAAALASPHGSTAPSNSDPAHSGGVAKALPHLHSGDTSDRVPGSQVSGHSAGDDTQVSGPSDSVRISAKKRADGEKRRDIRSLLVPSGPTQHGNAAQAGQVPLREALSGFADDGGGAAASEDVNTVDGAVGSADGLPEAGGMRSQAGKRAPRVDGRGSWRRMWACCGSSNMTDA